VNLPFSIVILTLNEERDLPACLSSASGCEDLVVLDSGSNDRTAEIARAAGARVYERPFDTFAGQRNYAQSEIRFRHPWVFHLDADEQLTPDLAAECAAAARADTSVDGYLVAPKMLFEGRWIPHCTDYPAWQARFVRAPQFAFVDAGHGQREAPAMRLGRLRANYFHDLSSGGVEEWLAKHRRYARAEAEAYVQESRVRKWTELFDGSALVRRRALKHFSHSLPGRPILRFFYQYVLRGGFLDGGPGFRYCRLLARYESFTRAELRRIRWPASCS